MTEQYRNEVEDSHTLRLWIMWESIPFCLQDTSDLATGSANGYVTGQIYYDAFNVRILSTSPLGLHGIVSQASLQG